METQTLEAPDYTGVPLQELRQVIETYRKRLPTKVIAMRAGIDSREFARITRVAPGTAVIGLHKADRVCLALRQNLSDLVSRDELHVVPLGSGLITARRMARDQLMAEGICPTSERVEGLACELVDQKRNVIAALGRTDQV
jgi:hypothetical protein